MANKLESRLDGFEFVQTIPLSILSGVSQNLQTYVERGEIKAFAIIPKYENSEYKLYDIYYKR